MSDEGDLKKGNKVINVGIEKYTRIESLVLRKFSLFWDYNGPRAKIILCAWWSSKGGFHGSHNPIIVHISVFNKK